MNGCVEGFAQCVLVTIKVIVVRMVVGLKIYTYHANTMHVRMYASPTAQIYQISAAALGTIVVSLASLWTVVPINAYISPLCS